MTLTVLHKSARWTMQSLRISQRSTFAPARSPAPSPSRKPAAPPSSCGSIWGPDIGERKSSAQITEHYAPESLVGQRVMAVVNFAPRQIGPFMSEILVLGFPDANGAILLARPEASVANGARLA